MSNFMEIVDTYLSNYSSYPNGKVEFECKYGELTFYKTSGRALIVHAIYIAPEYREQGLCRDTIQYLIDNTPRPFNRVCVQCVISKILYEYLSRFCYKDQGFKFHGGRFEYVL